MNTIKSTFSRADSSSKKTEASRPTRTNTINSNSGSSRITSTNSTNSTSSLSSRPTRPVMRQRPAIPPKSRSLNDNSLQSFDYERPQAPKSRPRSGEMASRSSSSGYDQPPSFIEENYNHADIQAMKVAIKQLTKEVSSLKKKVEILENNQQNYENYYADEFICSHYCKFDFTATKEDELSVRENEELKFINEEGVDYGWMLVENSSGEQGLVPSTYLEENYQ